MKQFLLIVGILLSFSGWTQSVQDSAMVATQPDTAVVKKVVHLARAHPRPKPPADSIFHTYRNTTPFLSHPPDLSDTFMLAHHPYFTFTNPVRQLVEKREWHGKEALFYSLIALLLYFALIRNGFKKYFTDLFRSFFRTTLQQKQLRDQLLQSPLPSIFFNVFFVLSEGYFIMLLVEHFQLRWEVNFWLMLLYCAAAVAVMYTVKFVSLKLLGWIFQLSDAMNTYIFIVFTSNKVIGVMLLPFLALLAFSSGPLYQAALTLSLLAVVALFAYRYFLAYISVQRQIQIHFFHFLLYLLAFEVAPLLLINKLLVTFLRETS